jgi:malonyl CoA-acyl carrier protein transacylase/surfactin synthase thioesterase subunit/acyl carrier protein
VASSSLELVTLSAVTAESLAHMRVALADWLAVHLEASLGDVAFTLNTGRQAFRHRWACVASTKAELLRALTAADEHDDAYPDDDDELASYWSGEAAADEPRPGGDAPAGWSVEHVAELSPPTARFRPKLPIDLASLQELAQRWSRGERIDFRPLYESRAVRRVPLPTYRFQRKRFWLEPPSRSNGPRGFGPWLGQAAAGAVGAEPGARTELLLLGGETEELLRRRAHACRALAAGTGAPNLSMLSLVASSQAAGAHRLAAVARTKEELLGVLDAYRRGGEDARLFRSAAPAGPVLALAPDGPSPSPRIAFVFSGQGGQWWGMGRDLLNDEPVFRRTIEACAEVLDRLMGMRFMSIWRASETASRMGEIDIAQPAVFALQVGLAALWRSWGIVPDCVVGQSLGEVAAAHVSGALSLEDALAVVHHRSRLMKRVAGQGRTASVELSMDEALLAITGYEDRLGVAGSNAPAASVLSGSPDALEEVLDKLRARGVSCRELRVDLAAHSPHMDPLVPELEELLAAIAPRPAAVPLYSTVDVTLIDGEQLDAKYWGRNLREPFRFAATIERMATDGHARFLELAPHPVLSHAVKQTLHNLGRGGTVLPSLHRDRADRDVMLRTLGSLYADGHAVTWPPLEQAPAVSETAAAATDQTRTVPDRVRALVAEALLAQPEDLADTVPLIDLGMDSVTGLSLIGKLATTFGVQLDTGELLRLGTIARIARRLERGPAAEDEPTAQARVPIRSTRDARADVVMFPGAGGTALMLAPWSSPQLIDGANISAMDPPGHGKDKRPPIRTMSELVDLYVPDLIPAARPLILVGYSLGGLVAYAVAHALERRGLPPAAVIVSHTLPPPVWRKNMFSRDAKFEQVFGGLYEAWGIDAQSRATFLESARADFELAESYDAPSTKLAALTCVISSAGDEFAPAHQLLDWSALCERVAHYAAEGGHWDFLEHPANRELLRSVYARTLQAAAAAERRPWGHLEVVDRWQASGTS